MSILAAAAPANSTDEFVRYRAILSRVSLFAGLPVDALDDLACLLQVRARNAGAMILAQDEPADALFVLAEGQAKVALFGENGREITLSVLRPGDFFGEMALFDG